MSSPPPYRTVLSVSRSQSLGRDRREEEEEEEEEEEVAGCWSTANSGTNARLSPLKVIAGSIEVEKKTVRRSPVILKGISVTDRSKSTRKD